MRDKLAEYRLEGMVYAYKQIKENGLEAFEKELAFRSPLNLSIPIKQKELKKITDDVINRSMNVILVFALAVLHDEFGFGAKRCKQFVDRFNSKTAGLVEDYITWDEQMQIIKDELGIEVKFG